MTKEPTREDVLKEIKRRKRKDFGKYGDKNISYKSLLDLYVRRCKVRNLSEATIQGCIKDDIVFTHVVEQKEVKEIYTKEELEKLLVRPQNGTFGEVRAWTIINTLISTGIRAGELRALKIKDVKIDKNLKRERLK